LVFLKHRTSNDLCPCPCRLEPLSYDIAAVLRFDIPYDLYPISNANAK